MDRNGNVYVLDQNVVTDAEGNRIDKIVKFNSDGVKVSENEIYL